MRRERELRLEDYEAILRRATAGVLDSRDQQRLIALIKSQSRARTVLMAVIVVTGTIVIWLFVTSGVFQMPSMLKSILGPFLGATAGFLILRRRSGLARRSMSKALKHKGIRPNICLMCLYDLKGSVSSQCPECGEPLAPASDPRQQNDT